jgi:hypothetical protein
VTVVTSVMPVPVTRNFGDEDVVDQLHPASVQA